MSASPQKVTAEPQAFPTYVVDVVEPQPAFLPEREAEYIVAWVPEGE